MSLLASLNMTSETRLSNETGSPLHRARASVLHNIQVQRDLLAHERNGTSPANMTKVVTKNGVETTRKLRPRRWFFKSPTTGEWLVQVLVGHKPLVIRDGMTSIVAGDLDAVEATLNLVAQAVQANELDTALSAAIAARAARPKTAKGSKPKSKTKGAAPAATTEPAPQ